MKVDTSKMGLVRGYVIYSQWGAGCISMDEAKDDNNINVGVAYTPWHRHDEDPAIVEGELKQLMNCYSHFKDWEGSMMGFEYRSYSK